MNGNDLNDYAAIAQIIVPIITLIGIILSMWLSVKALREVQTDRKLRQMPHLAFELGGGRYSIEFRKTGKSVLGIDPEYAQKIFSNVPDDAESISLKTEEIEGGRRKISLEYGKLKNYGLGTALNTEVVWIPQQIKIGTELFRMTRDKLMEPQYSPDLNCIPASPSNILPGEIATFFRLPTFIQKDFEKKISEVSGTLTIKCEDIFSGKHTKHQEFYIFTDYKSENPYIHITFGEILEVSSS